MKKIHYMFGAIVLCLFYINSNAQQLFNENWQLYDGNPAKVINHSKTIMTDSEEIITVGNIVQSNLKSDIHITKVSNEGDTLWNIFYNSEFEESDFGVSALIDGSGYLNVIGSVYKPSTNQYLPVVLRYDEEGDLINEYLFDEAEYSVIPTALFLDNSGNIVVTCAAQDSMASLDILTFKLTNNFDFEWQNTFDYNSKNDVPFAISIGEENNYQIIGTSQGSEGVYFASIITLDDEDGDSLYSYVSGEYYFDLVKDVYFDDNGNKYIAGAVLNENLDYDLKIMVLDSALELVWEDTYDGFGENDIVNRIFVNQSGEVFSTGSIGISSNQVQFFISKHNSNGTLNFINIDTLTSAQNSAGHAIQKNDEGFILVAGYEKGSGATNLFLEAYKETGERQWRYIKSTNGQVTPTEIFTESGKIYVAGMVNGITNSYYKLSLSTYNRNSLAISNHDAGNHIANEVLLDFARSAINKAFVNDESKIFGSLQEVLTETAYEEIHEGLSELVDLSTITIVKAVPHMKTTDTVSISRGGQKVYIPKFWTKMVLKSPDSLTHETVYSHLHNFGIIEGFSLNRTFETSSFPNDGEYNRQHSLQSTGYPTGHINVEDAWDIETGKPFVKVGIFDTGIYWGHEEFKKDNSPKIAADRTIIRGGFDYYQNLPVLNSSPSQDIVDGHGTKVAGIIAASRNNGFGIAGVAGGDFTNHLGVSLYNYKLFGFNGTTVGPASMDRIVSAVVDGATFKSDTSKISPGLHIMNLSMNSYDFANYPNVSQNDHYQIGELEKAYRYAFKNEVTVVASRGNHPGGGNGSEIFTLPTSYPDELVISVSGSGIHGYFDNPIFHFGHNVDLIAPSDNSMITTTTASLSWFGSFGYTSAATPHVSGVAGLMHSYINEEGCYSNISPEDVEEIMQLNTFYFGPNPSTGYDNKNGHGLINAGGVLQSIEYPHYKIRHYEIEIDSTSFSSDGNHFLTFSKKAGRFDSLSIGAGLATRYEVQHTFNLNLETNETVLGVWPRFSATETYKQYNDSVLNRAGLTEFTFDTVNETVTMKGNVYFVLLNQDVWLPYSLNKKGKVKLSFTAYTYNPDSVTSFSYPCDSMPKPPPIPTSVKSYGKGSSLKIYPNPTTGRLLVELNAEKETETTVFVTDISGKVVSMLFQGKILGQKQIDVNLNLQPGIYFVISSSENGMKTQKLIINQ